MLNQQDNEEVKIDLSGKSNSNEPHNINEIDLTKLEESIEMEIEAERLQGKKLKEEKKRSYSNIKLSPEDMQDYKVVPIVKAMKLSKKDQI